MAKVNAQAPSPPGETKNESAFQNLRQKIEGNLKKSEKSHGHKSTQVADSRGKKRRHNGDVKKQEDVDLKSIVAELGGTQEDLDLIDGANSDSELEGHDGQQQESHKGKSLESGMANILKEIALVRHTYQESGEETMEANGTERDPTPVDKPSNDEVLSKSAVTEGKNPKPQAKLRLTPRPDWFNHELPEIPSSDSFPESRTIQHLHSYARKLLQEENEAFKATQASSSSQAFYNTVITSGTLSDKISALTLAVQESPLHNLKALEGLLGLAKKRSRSQAVDVLRALKDLFAQGSMLPDRRLYTFGTQPGLSAFKKWQEGDRLPVNVGEAHLVAWAYEDWLKEQYFEVLKILETWCNDEIEFAKTRATSYIYELLKEKPEQEANLLKLLINKLGDPVKKIASQASYLIMQLLSAHPAMKEIVISAIDTDFIFKPGQTTHARYYATVTLNQTALSQKEENVAVKLLDIYFGTFKLLLKTEGKQPGQKRQTAGTSNEQEEELREKLISAILTGVNRAYPYSGTDHQSFESHLDTLFQITHSANFNTSVQALMLIQQLVSTASAAGPTDRFYRTLYESLLDPRLITSSKQQLYLNLLHRSLKAELNQKRVKAFVKRILQVLSIQDPSFICAAFFLLKDLEQTFPSLATMLDQPEDDEGDMYDSTKRDPAHANADASCLWDVLPYLLHYHPSVRVSAEHLIDHKALPGKPDLTLHTMIHFLDRFVYKNKLSGKMRGSSIMQPLVTDNQVFVNSGGLRQLPVNSAEFLAKKEVAPEEVFFHKYFKAIGKTPKRTEEPVGDDSDNEDEIWQAMVRSGHDLDGFEEDEEISDMEGFEGEMAEGEAADETDDEGAMPYEADEMEIEDGSVDIEAGIFDDNDEEEEEGQEFGDLQSEIENAKQPSRRTVQQREEREKKKKLKALPTFAAAEDYLKMLEDDEGEDIG